MDRDLGLLHSPDYSLIEESQTWLQGPFGVFEGLKNIPSDILRKRRKLTKNKYARQRLDNMQEVPTEDDSRSKSSVSIRRSNSRPTTPIADNLNPLNDIPKLNWQPGNIFEHDQFKVNHEWLSNELRFDALLSATAATTSNDQLNLFSELLYPFQSPQAGIIPGRTHAGSPASTTTSLFQNEPDAFAYDREVFNAVRPQSHAKAPWPVRSLSSDAQRSPNSIVIETAESSMPENVIKIINTPVLPELNPSLNIPTTGLRISSLTRFLLDHYFHNLADIMTVVMFPKNPWKMIYFPRAVLALGDLAAMGKSSNSRMSLLNALLAVSCFNLQSKFEKGSTEMKFFLNLGIQFRSQASAFLKKMLQGDLSISKMNNERYKDVVVSFLSMNTIDVVWGTMADCQYHLSLCGEFIARRMEERPQMSKKAKSLHRIFSFLKLVQDSTNFQNLSSVTEDQREKYLQMLDESEDIRSESQESIDLDDGLFGIEFVSKALQETEYKPKLIDNETSTSKAFQEIMLTEALYGMPNSLILLFSKAVRLLKLKLYLQSHPKVKDENKFKKICATFEKKLLEWKPEWKLNEDEGKFFSPLHEGLYHHMHSFHNALIVYYFTLVRELGDIFLQKHCTDCVEHLENLQKMNEAGTVMILPMFWQGFITGCSATEPALRNRFREWAAKLATVGLGSYWGARQIMFEVWRRRKNSEINDNWLSVHKEWEMNLMLP
jgi:arginine metabolism regulation protein II